MKILGQLEQAGLEQLTSAPTPAFPGRVYTDITTPSAAVPYIYDGTSWKKFLTTYQTTSYDLLNVGLAVSVQSSAMTINLKQSDGATAPSAASPCYMSFRDSTLASGLYSQVAAVAATSLVVPAGATLGMASAVSGYLWIYAINNGGVIELAISGVKYDEGTTRSSTSIGAGSTSISTIYSTNGRSNKAIRLIGRLNIVEATAGTWASLPTEIALAPDILAIEEVCMSSNTSVSAFTSGGGSLPMVTSNLLEDTHNGFSSGIYTVRKAGRYLTEAGYYSSSSYTIPTIGHIWYIEIQKNLSAIARATYPIQTTSTCSNMAAAIAFTARYAVGDTIQPFGGQNIGTGTMTLDGSAVSNWFNVSLIP